MNKKIKEFIRRNRKRNSHLYNDDLICGKDYVVCPESGERLSMIKRNYVENVLKMEWEHYIEKHKNIKLICDVRIINIKQGLTRIDVETGYSKHKLSSEKSKITRLKVDDNGLTPNDIIGIKTKQAHMAKIDANGHNGYKRIANNRNSTICDNGLSVQQNGLIKRAKTRISSGNTNNYGASKLSKKILRPLLQFLDNNNIRYFFDHNEFGLMYKNSYFLYDLVIPDFKLAVEFQGAKFHPGPELSKEELKDWVQMFSRKTAVEIIDRDQLKADALYEKRGFVTFYVYEKCHNIDLQRIIKYIENYVDGNNIAYNDEWEILTDTGWQDFKGTVEKGIAELIKLTFSNGISTEITEDHIFFQSGKKISTKHLVIGDTIDGYNCSLTISNIEKVGESVVFDMYEVSNGHKFIMNNGIITKNCDEIAFVRPAIQNEFWTSIQPTLATGGSCIITSTPNGDTDLFSSLCRGAELRTNDFKYIFVPWNAPPGRDEEFKRREIANIGERKWRQEYECEFITSEGTLVDDLIIKNLKKIVEDRMPVMEIAGEKLWVNINPRRSYIISCDPGTGTGLDNSAIQVVEFPTMIQVLESATNTLDSAQVYSKIKNIARYITSFGADVFFCFEQNGVGEGIAALYTTDEEPIEAVLLTSQTGREGRKRLGYVTDIRNKVKFCLRLKKVIESEILKINSIDFLIELQRFVRDGHTYSAQPGATDDRIMAMILILRAVEQMAEYDENAYTICYSFHNEQQDDWNTFHNKDEEDDLLPLPMFG